VQSKPWGLNLDCGGSVVNIGIKRAGGNTNPMASGLFGDRHTDCFDASNAVTGAGYPRPLESGGGFSFLVFPIRKRPKRLGFVSYPGLPLEGRFFCFPVLEFRPHKAENQ